MSYYDNSSAKYISHLHHMSHIVG